MPRRGVALGLFCFAGPQPERHLQVDKVGLQAMLFWPLGRPRLDLCSIPVRCHTGAKTMSRLAMRLINFLADEDGPTAVEYAVMLALIIVVCMSAITLLGSTTNSTFIRVNNAIGGTAS
jgi:pilus assembly protein Flp/PilA